jgi:acyl-CoA ligase (AMP-forming) (exosortase A-associated)
MREHRAGRPPALPVRADQLLGYGAPGDPALTFRSLTLSYAQLREQVARVASGLHALGVGRGDRVAVYAEKRIETVVALLATSAAGAVFVPVNPLARPRQLGHVLADCGPRAVITTTQRQATVRAALDPAAPAGSLVLIGGTEDKGHPESTGGGAPGDCTVHDWTVRDWAELASSSPGPVPGAAGVIDEDIAAILYTSGSTGGPKGVVLSHRNLLAGAASVAGYLGHGPDDVILAVLPLSFDAGLSQVTTTLIAGAHVVLMNYLVPADVPRLCARHQVTGLTCVPPLWQQLAGPEWPAAATARLRYFASTGGRMPRVTLDRLRGQLSGAAPFLMYGLTEAFRSCYLDPAEVDRRPGSIGKAIPNAEILVVRPDGTPCAPGEHGELVHRGALVARGYWNDPARTAERFRPAPGSRGTRPEIAVWSGDTVYRDEDGFLYFVGRADEMIKTSGYRVSPTEIEEAAYATGMVAEAVAMGVEDARLGQRIALAVTLREPGRAAGDLARALAGQLPAYMRPQHIDVLAELPRSPNGKFDRAGLRQSMPHWSRPAGAPRPAAAIPLPTA